MVPGLQISLKELICLVNHESLFAIHKSMAIPRYAKLLRIQVRTHGGGKSINLWQMFTWVSLRYMIAVEQTMKTSYYIPIPKIPFQSYMLSVFPNGNGFIQQDNAPCNKANIVREWLEEKYAVF